MPIANIIIVLFILAMIYMGTVQGLFSSFLHLLVVIAAGTLAFALWEPITLGLLMKYQPAIAWTLGLLIPFGLILLILRMASDRLVPANAQFHGVVNLVLGGACGFASGVLTAGITIIGIGFLPFGPNLGGIQPYTIGRVGVVQPGEAGFWIPVHRVTANFYSALSRGAFATRTPMAEYMPKLDVQMALLRLRPDNVSIVAPPDAVDLLGVYEVEASVLAEQVSPGLAEALGPEFRRPGYRIVAVDTEWSKVPGAVDADRALRLPASHMRLITRSKEAGSRDVDLTGPVGFSKLQGDKRVFYPYDSASQVAFSVAPKDTFAFVYLIPSDREALFPLFRNLRLTMPEQIESDPAKLLEVLGAPPAPKPEGGDEGEAGAGTAGGQGQTTIGDSTGPSAGSYALDLEVTNRLPRVASKNTISGLKIGEGPQGAVILDGSTGSARKPAGSVGQRNKIVGFDIAPHEAMVRIRLDKDYNRTILGVGLSEARALNPIFLKDTQGNMWYPTAWVWEKSNGDQEIHFDAFNPVRNATQLPLSRKDDSDEFYLYFTVTKPVTLVSYNIGEVSEQPFEPPLRIE